TRVHGVSLILSRVAEGAHLGSVAAFARMPLPRARPRSGERGYGRGSAPSATRPNRVVMEWATPRPAGRILGPPPRPRRGPPSATATRRAGGGGRDSVRSRV